MNRREAAAATILTFAAAAAFAGVYRRWPEATALSVSVLVVYGRYRSLGRSASDRSAAPVAGELGEA